MRRTRYDRPTSVLLFLHGASSIVIGGPMIAAMSPFPARRPARRRPSIVAALAAVGTYLLAGVAVTVGGRPVAAAVPAPVITAYVPLPATDLERALASIATEPATGLELTVAITSTSAGAVIVYDHWEDGLETDPSAPAQATTLVWGDGDPTNGDAAAVCARCAGDLVPAGAVLVQRSVVAVPRDPATVVADGGDKVTSTRGFSLVAAGWTTDLGTILASAVSAFDTTRFGTAFDVPVGEDAPIPAGASPAFGYTGASIMAAQPGTVVRVDADGDGVADRVATIGEGRTLFVDGGLRTGARITASAPVQVHLVTGDVGAAYESRSYVLLPTELWTDDYLSPVGSSVANYETVVVLFNPGTTDLGVTVTCAGCAPSVTVPPRSTTSIVAPLGQALRVQAPSGRPFAALGAPGAHAGAGGLPDISTRWDWGFTLVPARLLTTQLLLGWAPGDADTPPSTPDADPVWITTTTATVLHVDFDGDPATGALGADCVGAHDLEVPVAALASTRLTDPNDDDLTGARIYTCDGTALAGAWGEDPEHAPPGFPGLDAGTTLLPSTTLVVDKSAALAVDAHGDGRVGPGDTLEYRVGIANAGDALAGIRVHDPLPPGTDYVAGSAVLVGATTTPVPDDAVPPAATPYPLDEGGAVLPAPVPGDAVELRYRVRLRDPFPSTALTASPTLTNAVTVTVDGGGPTGTDQVVTPLAAGDLSVTADEVGGASVLGDDAVWRVVVANAGPDPAPAVRVHAPAPAGTALLAVVAPAGAYDPATGVWTVGTVLPGAAATLELTTTLDVAGAELYAEVVGAGIVDVDSTPAEGPLGPGHPPDEDDEAVATAAVAPPAGPPPPPGPPRPGGGASAAGTVWFDADGDGARGAGEAGLGGVRVRVDSPGVDGVLGTGDDVGHDAVTDAAGAWSVGGLDAGRHRVRVDRTTLPAGVDVATGDPDGAGTPDVAVVDLPAGPTSGLDFGYLATGAASGTVFEDVDGDGRAGAGEALAGVTVRVTAGAAARLVVTDGDGRWVVARLAPGGASVEVDRATVPAGLVDVVVDPDPELDARTAFVLGAGEQRDGLDVGFRSRPRAEVPVPGTPGRIPATGARVGPLVRLGAALVTYGVTALLATRIVGRRRRTLAC